MNIFFLMAVTFFVSCHALFGQIKKLEFIEYDLKNGLHVILHQDNTVPIVAVSVLYHVGSKNESPERTGFAHFFEHLLFEGSKYIKRGEFDNYTQLAGGTNNAYTTSDITFFHEMFPSNQLAMGLWLESERMMHAKIDSLGVEIQREVVKEEKRQNYDSQPYASLYPEIRKRAYTIHPYRWNTIGSPDHLEKATPEEFMAFYNTFYVPENAILSIAGDIDIEQTKELIVKYFQDIPSGNQPIPRPTVVEPPQKHEICDTIYDNIQLPAVVEAYRIPARGTDDAYILDVLSRLLSRGKSSRIQKSLVDEQQKAAMFQSFPDLMEDSGIYLIFGIANVGVSVEDLEKGLNMEIEKIRNKHVSDRELQKVKNQIESVFVQANSSALGIAERLAQYYVYEGHTDLINTEIDQLMKVTPEDLQRVANKYLTRENRVLLYYLPKTEEQLN